MEKLVVISIKGIQEFDKAEPDVTELVTQGWLSQEGPYYVLSYQESEVTGMEGTQTTFHITPDQVTLMREGGFNSQMVFEEGRRHLSMYNTPFGSMAVGVHTRHLLADVDENGGTLEIDYAIEIDHSIAGRNVFQIHVKPSESEGSLKQ